MTYFKGNVKWFNNKAGYGFITVKEDACEIAENLQKFAPFIEKDIFVHHSVIQVTKSVFRYLMPGEQVRFEITVPDTGKHNFQASNVCALEGNLKCETRLNKRHKKLQEKSVITSEATVNEVINETVNKVVSDQ